MRPSSIFILAFILVVFSSSLAFSAGWSDNFDGGAQQDWGYVDNGDHSTWGVVNNQYQIHTQSNESATEGVICYVNYSGTNAVIQSRVKQINAGDKYLASIGLRGNASDKNCYSFLISSELNSWVWIIKITNNVSEFLYAGPLPLGATFDPTDCVMKFQAEGDLLSAKVWSGEPEDEPADWQINVTDSSFKSGTAGIGVSTSDGLNFYNAQAAFDDVVFTTDSVSPEITEFTLDSNPSDHYLFLFDIDQTKPENHLDGLWLEPGQLSSSTSTPPAYTGIFGTIARTFNSTCDGDQENSYGNLMLSIDASSSSAFYNEISHLQENMPYNENAFIFGKWGGHEGPINKNNINLRGIPEGTTVTFTVKMNNEIPHALAVMGGSMPNVTYDETGFSGAGELTITTTTCRPTSNNGWTPDDSTVGFLIFTNPDYGYNEHIGLIAQANHWAGDCFILLPGYDYEAPIDAGDMGVSNAKAGVTMIGQTGDTRDINIFFPDSAIGDIFGPGINEDEIMAFVNNNPNYKATVTNDAVNFNLEGTQAEFECTFASPVTVSFGVPSALLISAGSYLIADFGNNKGIYVHDGASWIQLSGWGDAHDMIEWNQKLVVDFGRGRGIHYYDPTDSQWHEISGWDTTAGLLSWDDGISEKLVLDFGQGKGIHIFDGFVWNKISGWDDVSNIITFDDGFYKNLVVDFGSGHGIFGYNTTYGWFKIAGWDDAAKMTTWNDGHATDSKLIVDFGSGRGLYSLSNPSGWDKLAGWDDAANMLAWNDGVIERMVVDFGYDRGIYTFNGSAWNVLSGWDTTENLVSWGTGLVMDFGLSRGLYDYSGAWSKLAGWDDAIKITEWGSNLAVDFGPGKGIYTHNGSAWSQLSGWSTGD